MPRRRIACLTAIAFVFAAASQTFAAQDYELAVRLLEQEGLTGEELVERLAGHLDRDPDPAARLEGKLVRAALYGRQAGRVSAERRSELAQQATKCCNDFLAAAPERHPLRAQAEKDLRTFQVAFVQALRQAAERDPAQAGKLRAQALETLAKNLTDCRAVLPALKARLDAVWPKEPIPDPLLTSQMAALEKAAGAYLEADQEVVNAWLQLAEAHAAGPERAEMAHGMAAYCEAQANDEKLMCFPAGIAWYGYMKGKAHTCIGEEKEAIEAWEAALDAQDIPEGARPVISRIRFAIAHDWVRMKMAGAEREPAKYADVARFVDNLLTDGEWLKFFEEPRGKDALLQCARAHVLRTDATPVTAQRATERLRRVLKGGPPWSYNASRVLAEVLDVAIVKKIAPVLEPETSFEAGHGWYLRGMDAERRRGELEEADEDANAQKHGEAARVHFARAVEYFKTAIGGARKAEAGAFRRLKIEPQAWFELALCAYRLGHFEEAALAGHALCQHFAPEARGVWLPDRAKLNAPARMELDAALAALDAPESGLLARAAQNRKAAYRKLVQTNGRPLRPRPEFGDLADTPYQRALAALDNAKERQGYARRLDDEGKGEEAAKIRAEALEKLESAAADFDGVEPGYPAHEVSAYQAPACRTQALLLLASTDAIAGLEGDARATRVKDLAAKALAGFDAYVALTGKAGNNTAESDGEDAGSVRVRMLRAAQRSRIGIHRALEDWLAVLAACDAWLKDNATDDTARTGVSLDKFRALLALAAKGQPPACDKYLEDAELLLAELKARDDFHRYALQALSARYQQAGEQAEAAALGADAVNAYRLKLAALQAKALAAMAEPQLRDYDAQLYALSKANAHRALADLAVELLARFDPQSRNRCMPDANWPAFAKLMEKQIAFSDYEKLRRCREAHRTLVDFLYETREGAANADRPEKRPKDDRFPCDYIKAREQLASIRANYPGCATAQPTQKSQYFRPDEHLSYLDAVEKEVDFRRRILALRSLLLEHAPDAAKAAGAANDEPARLAYLKAADAQISILLEEEGEIPELLFQQARIRASGGNVQGAIEVLTQVRAKWDDTESDLYIRASVERSRLYFEQGKFEDAAEYPRGKSVTVGLDSPWVKKHWPDIKAFLDACYAKGAKALEVADAGGAPPQYHPKTAEEKAFEELEAVHAHAMRCGERDRARLLTPGYVERYNLLKSHIAYYRDFQALERERLKLRSAGHELADAPLKRHALLKAISEKTRALWRTLNAVDQAVMDRDSNAEAARRAERAHLVAAIGELESDLAGLPKE
ncbi:MAG: hypothetical protein L6R28_24260 [Planctomycetes bacterium]|nr:hypothetical protein [Planctomycetota bacterium]